MLCPCCLTTLPNSSILSLELPTTMNRVAPNAQDAKNLPKAALTLVTCHHCGITTNTSFDPTQCAAHFDQTYSCAQHHSKSWSTRVKHTVQALCSRGYNNVVEIGCAQGWVLSQFEAHGCQIEGFDPTYSGHDTRIKPRLYQPGEPLIADLVYIQHVLDEVPHVQNMLQGIKQSAPNAEIFLDVLDAQQMFQQGNIWDVAYERCHYFMPQTLAACFHQTLPWTPTPGYIQTLAKIKNLRPYPGTSDLPEPTALQKNRERLYTLKNTLRSHTKPIYIWGASNKGGNLANLLDPHTKEILALWDINPAKAYQFLPGTGHQILPPQELSTKPPGLVIVTNASYLKEIKDTVAHLAPQPNQWDIVGLKQLLQKEPT